MPQGLLPFHYEEDPRDSGVTGLAGLALYLDLAHAIELRKVIRTSLTTKTRGWTDAQLLMSAILLNLAGGDRVDDLEGLEKDDGFVRLLMRVEDAGLRRRDRREKSRRWRREKRRGIPSPPAMRRFLDAFHDPAQEARRKRSKKKAFVPAQNEHLKALAKINAHLVAAAQTRDEVEIATLDMDATLVRTKKEQALYCYKKHKAYQPLNVWWAQQEMMLYTEFRDGNVGAGERLARVFKDPENRGHGWDGEQVIKWYRKRCGKSEAAHSVLKSDLAAGVMPSKRFGTNAAWWWMSILSMNLNALLKRFCLGGNWVDRRLKALRYRVIKLPGLVLEHARRLIVRIARGHPAFALLLEARARIAQWKPVPGG